jgi:exonuclease-1
MAPYEANAQLPWLPRLDPIMGGVSALISKDNDLIAYCCPAVGTNESSSQSLFW